MVFTRVVVASVVNAVKVSQNVACHKMCFSFSSYAVTRTWNMNTCLLIKIMFLGHKNIFSHKTVIEQVSYTNLKNRSKVSLISHACCTTASKMPHHETVVNLVPEAKLSDRLLVLQLGVLCLAIFS